MCLSGVFNLLTSSVLCKLNTKGEYLKLCVIYLLLSLLCYCIHSPSFIIPSIATMKYFHLLAAAPA